MTAASNERKRFLSWPRPVCQEPFTPNIRRSAHVSCDMNNNLSGNYIESSPWVSNTEPKTEEKRTRASSLALARLSANKSYANMCRFERKIFERIIVYSNWCLLDFLYYCSFPFFFLSVCVRVYVLFWCSLRDRIHWSRRIQGRSVNELFESTISVLSRLVIAA